MFCKQCGTPVEDGVSYCPKCGSKIGQDQTGQKGAVPSSSAQQQKAAAPEHDSVKYRSTGCTKQFLMTTVAFSIVFLVIAVALFILSSATRSYNYLGSILSRPVFNEGVRLFFRIAGLLLVVIAVSLLEQRIPRAKHASITVYPTHIEGTPFSHGKTIFGAKPGHCVIQIADILSAELNPQTQNSLLIIRLRTGNVEQFACQDAERCVSVIQEAMRASQH